MPRHDIPSGTLSMLLLRVLRGGPLHGYAIAQRIKQLSSEILQVEEGSLYPALQRLLKQGHAKAEWGTSETNRKVRFYKLTPAGRKALDEQLAGYDEVSEAIQAILLRA